MTRPTLMYRQHRTRVVALDPGVEGQKLKAVYTWETIALRCSHYACSTYRTLDETIIGVIQRLFDDLGDELVSH